MKSISEFFTLEEAVHSNTADRLEINNAPDRTSLDMIIQTARRMDEVRRFLGKPIIVSSWYRCADLNKAVKGAKKSAHVTGEAVDFICPAFGDTKMIVDALSESTIEFDQVIAEFVNSPSGGWVHISFAKPLRRMVLTVG